jgi:predicted transcriptional regulator
MTTIPTELAEAADSLKKGSSPRRVPVRTLLSWFNAQRRGVSVIREIRAALRKVGLKSEPDFVGAYLDSQTELTLKSALGQADHLSDAVGEVRDPNIGNVVTPDNVGPALPAAITTAKDPTYRIGKLASANRVPTTVAPNDDIRRAITLMMANDFSQLPVTNGPRSLRGVISWSSLGKYRALHRSCDHVSDCMEVANVVSADMFLFDAIRTIVERDYAIVKDETNAIVGIVTTADLAIQFRGLSEPFLVIAEIENHLRNLIEKCFSVDELQAAKDPAATDRVISNVSEMTFGEYLRLIEQVDKWRRLSLDLDRVEFVRRLEDVRRIRNDVVHFDPDGVGEEDLEKLRETVHLLQQIAMVE